MRLELSDRAQAQAEQIDQWWRRHRPATADLFMRELEQALDLLEYAPGVGVPYQARSRRARRLRLRRTNFHVYFAEKGDFVLVLAIWSAFRKRGPRL